MKAKPVHLLLQVMTMGLWRTLWKYERVQFDLAVAHGDELAQSKRFGPRETQTWIFPDVRIKTDRETILRWKNGRRERERSAEPAGATDQQPSVTV